jgi:hypothetical protein
MTVYLSWRKYASDVELTHVLMTALVSLVCVYLLIPTSPEDIKA